MGYEDIILEKRENIAILTLNRPDKLNAITEEMGEEMLSAIADVNDDDEVRGLLVTGAGRGFCSGADVSRIAAGRAAGGTSPAGEARERPPDALSERDIMVRFNRGLQKMKKPTIAMVNGVAAGVGCDIAFSCDLILGSENARFVNAFIRIGIPPGDGGAWLYPRVMGVHKALEFLLTGDFIEAKEAERVGILNYLVPAAELEEKAMSLARRMAEHSPRAIELSKRLLYQGLSTDFETVQHLTAAYQSLKL